MIVAARAKKLELRKIDFHSFPLCINFPFGGWGGNWNLTTNF